MAEIEAKNTGNKSVDQYYSWLGVTESDTVSVEQWGGGVGCIEVTGTFGGATVTTKYGFDADTLTALNTVVPVDSNKLIFTEAGFATFEMPRGHINFTISGGAGQSLDIKIRPKVNE